MSFMQNVLAAAVGSAIERPARRLARRTMRWGVYALGTVGLLLIGWWSRASAVEKYLAAWALLLAATGVWLWRHRDRTPAVPALPPAELEPTWLYRWYDEQGCLMYVGVSNDLERRTGEHENKPWMRQGVTARAECFPTREQALAAERWAIETEHPLWNVQHSRRWA